MEFMKRYWLVTEEDQYAVYDSKEKTITEWVNAPSNIQNAEEMIFDLQNNLERHDEEIGDIEDEHGNPVIKVIAQTD